MIIHCKYDELINPKKLKNHPKNRNKHGQDQIDRLAELYEYHGIRHPVIVSKLSNCIVAGHGRRLAAIRAGVDEMPVVYQDFPSTEAEYAFIQADNAIALWAELDLSGINSDIGDLGPDFNIDMLGIKDFTLDPGEEDERDGDAMPEDVELIAKLGQIYKLGEHRLMCGDSTDEATVSTLMNGQKADMVFTDPPYGMFLDTDYDSMFASDKKHRKTGKRFDEVKGDHDDFTPSLIETIFKNFGYCEEMFIWGADYFTEFIENRIDGSWIVWDKRCSENMDKVSGNTFELCWSKKKHKRLIARIMWSGHHGMQKDDTKTRVHPTQKPVKLIEWFFNQWGKDTRAVVDIYGGSGSTLIACEKTKRKCFMMELDPHYIDVIIARWEKFTGLKAELINE